MPNIELTYFNGPGRAEPIRIALHIAGLSFTDHRVDFPGFMALKGGGSLPLGSLPVLDVDGFRVTQTAAMLRYVARLGAPDLYPTDAFAALVVDSAIDTFNDTLSHAMLPSLFERDMDKKLAMRKTIAEGPMRQAFTYIEGLITRSGGPFLVGDQLTIGDLVVALQVLQLQSGRIDGIGADYLETYPRMRRLAEAFSADPRIQAYQAHVATRS